MMASVGALIRREITLRSMPKFAPRIVRLEPSERFGQEVGKQINAYPTAVKRRQWSILNMARTTLMIRAF